MTIVMSIGHRTPHLMAYKDINNTLSLLYINQINIIKPESIITSLTPGADLIFASTAKMLHIPYEVYLPYSSQEKNWPKESKIQYKQILKSAQKITFTAKGQFTPQKIKDNTKLMLENADKYIVIWDGSPSIVKNYIPYIIESRKPFLIYDPKEKKIHDKMNS